MNKMNIKFSVLAVMIVAAAISRVIPHPYNFTPLVAMGLFAGANFQKGWQAYIIPIAAYFISDLFFSLNGSLGFYGVSQLFVYGAMILVTALGRTMKQPKALTILGYTLSGSTIFWIISNFGVWVASHYTGDVSYEPGLTLGMTYIRALPFYNEYSNALFFGSFAGDLFYSGILFGVYALIKKALPTLQLAKA